MAGKTAFNWDQYNDRAAVLISLRGRQYLVDAVLISSDGLNIPVHLMVVSTLGNYVTKEIKNQTKKSDGVKVTLTSGIEVPAIYFPDITGKALKTIVDYTYEGTLKSDPQGIWQVMDIAEKYQMDHVVHDCCSFMAKFLSLENCMQMYHLATRKKHGPLRHSALDTIANHFESIVQKSMFYSTLPLDDLSLILSNDYLNVRDESYVWTAIEVWLNCGSSQRKSLLKELLEHLRFHRVSQHFFDTLKSHKLINHNRFNGQIQRMVQRMIDQKVSGEFTLDGYNLPVGMSPVTVRPRIPYSIMLTVGGWISGSTSGAIETYDSSTNQWYEFKVNNPKERAYHGLQYFDGKLYMIGK